MYAAESERLWLQALNVEDHLQDYFEINSSPESMLWSTRPPHTNPEETQVAILNEQPTSEEPWRQRWAIMLKPPTNSISANDSTSSWTTEKPKMIGVMGTPRRAEIGYKLHPNYWGKGYMSEALTLFLKMFWESEANKSFTRLEAGADPTNTASTRVLEKAGFQKGEYKKDFLLRAASEGGKRSDVQFFYLDRPN